MDLEQLKKLKDKRDALKAEYEQRKAEHEALAQSARDARLKAKDAWSRFFQATRECQEFVLRQEEDGGAAKP